MGARVEGMQRIEGRRRRLAGSGRVGVGRKG